MAFPGFFATGGLSLGATGGALAAVLAGATGAAFSGFLAVMGTTVLVVLSSFADLTVGAVTLPNLFTTFLIVWLIDFRLGVRSASCFAGALASCEDGEGAASFRGA